LPLLLSGVACVGQTADGANPGGVGASGAGAGTTGQGTAGASGGSVGTAGTPAGIGGSAPGAGGTTGGGGSGAPAGGGGSGVPAGAGGSGAGTGGSTGTGGVTGTGGTGGEIHVGLDHCLYGYSPEASDATMKDGPAEFYPPGNMSPDIVDLTVQPEVLKWMTDHYWQAAHVEWHAIRTCNLPGGAVSSRVNICSFTNLVPVNQNCKTDGDGYEFLLMHRHMLQSLKQLWPKHTEQFEGFKKFPQSADDVPPQWRSAWKQWDADALAAGRIGDAIDQPENLARFPNEGVLGF